MIKFLFVRHGQSRWTPDMIKMGFVDESLNERGLEHAKNAACEVSLRLKGEKSAIIFSSTLKRAKETAAVINEHMECEVVELEQLREKYFGDHSLGIASDAESDEELSLRIISSLQEIEAAATQTQQDIVVVSHGYFFKRMCEMVSSCEKSQLDFGEISEVEFEPDSIETID